MKKILALWDKYENLSLKIALIFISFQIIHLFWLTTDVVLTKTFGGGAFTVFPPYLLPLQALIDYSEIPALVAGITFYSFSILRHRAHSVKNFAFLIMLALQFFHLFWITDEIVYEALFNSNLVNIPATVAWVAIFIDYLELPVMFDLFRRVFRNRSR